MPIPPLKRTRARQPWHHYQDRFLPIKRRPVAAYVRQARRGPPWFKGILILLILAVPVGAGALWWLTRELPSASGVIERPTPVSTKIYDREGKIVLYELYTKEKRTPIALAEIPEQLKWATIVREDRNFYGHKGLSVRGLLRAVRNNLFRGAAQGGSTITQQFVKNAVLTPEKKLTRKIKEVVLTWRIERAFTKDQILEMYLNEIPYGGSAYGVETAAQTFFGKSAKEVSLPEAAVLAVLPKAPSYYSPYGSRRKELMDAQKYLLEQMAELGYISEAQAEHAKGQEVTFLPFRERITAPHFVMYVRELLAEQFGENISQAGYKVLTTLDTKLQTAAEEAIQEGVARNKPAWRATNAALLALNPKQGDILAMVGSRDYFDTAHDGNFNVTLAPRQPGSSFKPVVYATLFATGAYFPDTILFDVNTVFKTDIGKPYAPKDYDGKERGPVSIRRALAGSLNIPAVKAIYLAGIEHVLDQAEALGYTTLSDRSRFGLSLVLGGGEVRLLEHVAAIASLGQDGVYAAPQAILKVEDRNGRTLWERRSESGKEVVGKQVARLVTNILSDNDARTFMFGANSKLQLGSRPVAAKTGTTNDFKDAWTVGFTPSLAAGVWVGNNDFTAMKRGADGSVVAAPIWNAFMRKALAGTPVEQFPKPDAYELPGKPMLNGKVEGEQIIRIDKASGKLATDLTPASYILEYRNAELHSILHYVKRDDPLGPLPPNPEDDPQYENWETAVARWAKENGYTVSGIVPPTEYDNLHVEANRPSLTVITPHDGTVVGNQEITVSAEAFAPRGMQRVEVSVDGKVLATITSPPYTAAVPLTNLANGDYTLVVTAFDDIDNARSVSVPIKVMNEQNGQPLLEWIKPAARAQLSAAQFPMAIIVKSQDPATKKIDLYLRAVTANKTDFLGVATAQNNRFTFIWDEAPPPGAWRLSAVLTKEDDSVIEGNGIDVIITP